jgi:hypothetical protein
MATAFVVSIPPAVDTVLASQGASDLGDKMNKRTMYADCLVIAQDIVL